MKPLLLFIGWCVLVLLCWFLALVAALLCWIAAFLVRGLSGVFHRRRVWLHAERL
jgi:hypothetical protein